MVQWEACRHAGATLRRGPDDEHTAEFLCPLTHGGEPDSGDAITGHPYAVVCDLYLQHTRPTADRDTYAADPGLGVS